MKYPVNWLEDELKKARAQLGPYSKQILPRGYTVIPEKDAAPDVMFVTHDTMGNSG
jgi:hypothetical protein